MSKLNYKDTFLGKEDDEYEIEYDVDVIKGEVEIDILTIDGVKPFESTIPVSDFEHITNTIIRNYDVGEHLDEVKTQKWESYGERDSE